ncbi:hypothetical protein JTE90_012180 [Oedothorax gibbosus]|uniref:MAM domain-containing protein n=1 Tax=Oedothorax gibbosus TaxID=931172 RepID=A0AAV6VBW9_9ARAC|nr:hypothetical protein JTE90_012180 [Oedothorax gibbosus]
MSPISSAQKYGKRWGAHCLTFWYWRPGQGNGSLSVLTRNENGKESQLWLEDRDVGMFWHFAQVTVDEIEAGAGADSRQKGRQ